MVTKHQRFTGVYRTPGSRWRAQFCCMGKVMQVGIYDTEEEAARAWDAAALHYRGRSTHLNFADSLRAPVALPSSLKRMLNQTSKASSYATSSSDDLASDSDPSTCKSPGPFPASTSKPPCQDVASERPPDATAFHTPSGAASARSHHKPTTTPRSHHRAATSARINFKSTTSPRSHHKSASSSRSSRKSACVSAPADPLAHLPPRAPSSRLHSIRTAAAALAASLPARDPAASKGSAGQYDHQHSVHAGGPSPDAEHSPCCAGSAPGGGPAPGELAGVMAKEEPVEEAPAAHDVAATGGAAYEAYEGAYAYNDEAGVEHGSEVPYLTWADSFGLEPLPEDAFADLIASPPAYGGAARTHESGVPTYHRGWAGAGDLDTEETGRGMLREHTEGVQLGSRQDSVSGDDATLPISHMCHHLSRSEMDNMAHYFQTSTQHARQDLEGSRSLLEYSEFQLERAKELNSYAKVSALNAELRAKHTLEVSTLVHKQQALAWPSHISTPHSLIPSDAGFQGMEGL